MPQEHGYDPIARLAEVDRQFFERLIAVGAPRDLVVRLLAAETCWGEIRDYAHTRGPAFAERVRLGALRDSLAGMQAALASPDESGLAMGWEYGARVAEVIRDSIRECEARLQAIPRRVAPEEE